MKVLWVTNTIFPDFSLALGYKAPVVGGWMYGLAKNLVEHGTELIVATAKLGTRGHSRSINGILYYLLNGQKPISEYDISLEHQWKQIVDQTQPDLIHIHGTEYAHGLSLIKACPNYPYITSIQGLVSIYSRYYTGQISDKEIRRNTTFRDVLKQDNLKQAANKFYKRGELVEKQYFKLTRNFIGRTQWDYDHTRILNPSRNYYFCNESLRDTFYRSKKWNLIGKNNYTIFLSQGNYPIKGLHQVIKAMQYVRKEFPDFTIRIAGVDMLKSKSIKDRLSLSGYAKYLLSLINKFGLHDHIEFTGFLDEQQMIKEYLKCHVFICPSSIENSPNSLGEAQLLGVPCIASYVGGVPDMVTNGKNGLLYRYEEIEMLACAIRSVFLDDELADKLSKNGIVAASKRHDRSTNSSTTLKIYKSVLNNLNSNQ